MVSPKAAVGLVVLGVAVGVAHFRTAPVDSLVAELYRPYSRIDWHGQTLIPGGEVIRFTPPMKQLIALGSRARPALHHILDDRRIQNEVVLILGAIGDEATVPLLIDRYPTALNPDDRDNTKMVCFSFALSYLTGQKIDRTRRGTIIDAGNARKWQDWWGAAKGTFRVPAAKPNATWVPMYPAWPPTGLAEP
jgi:hypothetical protein